MQGVEATADAARLLEVSAKKPIVIFEEIHKYSKWKNFLKGFYDTYKGKVHIIVTGSAKLDVYKQGSDSLMGHYFAYCVHPMSVAAFLNQEVDNALIRKPKKFYLISIKVY